MKHQTQKRMAEKLVTAKTEEKAKELEEEAMKVELKTKEEMKPWEQHSAVITIPRFDYNAPLLSSVIPTPDSSSPAPSVRPLIPSPLSRKLCSFFFFFAIFVLHWHLFM